VTCPACLARDDRKFLTPGVWVILVFMAIGLCSGAYRLFFGLEASTNLNQQYPWGIWIVTDVALIALAAGGFTTAAVVHVFHRHDYHELARPALVAAMLGYTFAAVVLIADLGRYYNVWHPILPSMWQGNSALFEVGMCVMCYVTVLYIEFIPVFCERFIGDSRWPRLGRICRSVYAVASKGMIVFLVAGVAISCLHQSSLGHVMVLARSKLHPLWYSPILALLFLLSAIAVGFPVAIAVTIVGAWNARLKPNMRMLSSVAKYIPFFVGIYLAFKIGDMSMRRSYLYLGEGSTQSTMYSIEVVAGLLIPFVMTISRRVRNSPGWLFAACLLVIAGVVINRTNVYLVGYRPAFASQVYVPSLAEWGLTIGALATLLFCWRVIVTFFPVISQPRRTSVA
jgi:Ni/Fe-hydrogenase subunit HybB-like protein